MRQQDVVYFVFVSVVFFYCTFMQFFFSLQQQRSQKLRPTGGLADQMSQYITECLSKDVVLRSLENAKDVVLRSLEILFISCSV